MKEGSSLLFAVDIGNSNIVFGCMDTEQIVGERLSTDTSKTELEYAIDIKNLLELHHIMIKDITGCIIASVVPQLTDSIRNAIYKITGLAAMVVGPGVKTGLNILIENPAQLGSDLVVAAVAGINEYALPLVIIDMGTATKFSVINSKGHFLGVAIQPGVKVALNSLVSKTSMLQNISLEAPAKVIGRNTIDCMKSGLIFGNAASIDGILTRIEDELGQQVNIVATGGLAESIVPHCKRNIMIDHNLILKGLKLIYERNAVQDKKLDKN